MIVKELVAKLGLEVDESSFEVGEKVLHALQHGAVALAGVVSAAGLALLGLTNQTAEAGDQAKKLAQRLGVSSDDMQAFGYAANVSEISTEELARAMQRLAKSGVADTREAMLALADQFHEMPDGAAKTKLALEKLGRGGARLIPVLNKGREHLAELADEARDFGLVLSKDDLDASEEFKENLVRLQKVFVGFRNRMTVGLIRPLSHFLEKLREGSKVVFDWAATWISKSENVQFVIGALTFGFLALGRGAAWAAVKMIGAWVAAAAPFLAAAAAILLVTILLQDLTMYLGNDGETAIGRFTAFFKAQFTGLGDFVQTLFAWMDSLVGNFFTDNLKRLRDFLRPISNFVSGYSGSLDTQSLVKGYAGADAKTDGNGYVLSGTVYASPQAAAAASNTTFAPVISVTVPEGSDANGIAKKIGDQIEAQWRIAAAGIQ